MSWDIYGQPLRRGYCEVHSWINQEYPCSQCMLEIERTRYEDEYEEYCKEQELQNEIEKLKSQLSKAEEVIRFYADKKHKRKEPVPMPGLAGAFPQFDSYSIIVEDGSMARAYFKEKDGE